MLLERGPSGTIDNKGDTSMGNTDSVTSAKKRKVNSSGHQTKPTLPHHIEIDRITEGIDVRTMVGRPSFAV
jgi:hypothetical protein